MSDGVRRLTHEEAEMLISARMDEHLDRADSRALLVHLQTCESCRAFAVQSEILGRELGALPVLPPSAIVDRQIRESIAKGNKRWSLAGLFPAAGGGGGLRTAVGALAVLTLVSVYLLVRMAGDNNGPGPAIEAPTGGLAQQLDTTTTPGLAMAQETTNAGPTETPRVIVPPAQQTNEVQNVEPTQAGAAPTKGATEPTEEASSGGYVQPTATLDSAYVYPRDKTKTPKAAQSALTPTAPAALPTQETGDVAIAAVGVDDGTPVEATEEAVATDEPTATETSEEAATPAESAEVDVTVAAEEPTEEPVTATPPEPTLEPTMTPTPVEISVEASEQPAEPATPPPADETVPESTEAPVDTTSVPDENQPESSPTDEPEIETPASTETPSEPFAQPTIAPVSGQSVAPAGGDSDGNDHGDGGHASGDQGSIGADDTGSSPPIVPSDGSDIEAANATGDDSSGSPQIVSTGATDVAGDAGTDSTNTQTTATGVGGETQPPEPSAIPTVDDSVEPSGLDLSDTVVELPAGTSSPLGRLEFSPGMDLYAVIAPDGQLAVANLDGELVVTFGAGDLPVWSGNAMMFSAPGESGTVVGIWDSDSGDLSYVPASDDEATSDLPIGGDGGSYYFLRTFPDRPGAMEIHSASIDGSDDGAIWSSDSANLGGARPVWSSEGILLPTDSSWLLIDADGSESELGANPYGFVGAPVLSPGEGLIAYSAGDQVVVAWSTDPGTAVATAPYGGGSGGYAFSTSGEQIVVSDGSSLHAVSYEGEDLGTLGGNQPIGAVYWISDTIYYVQIGQDAALKSTSLNAIQGD